MGSVQRQRKEPAAPAIGLLDDLRALILEARQALATTVNSSLTALYWRLGRRIQDDLLQPGRGEYGAEIIVSVARRLELDFGASFSEKNLRHMLKFVEIFPDEQIVSALRRQLSWSHLKTLIYLRDPLKRCFYLEMTKLEGWSTRTLQRQIHAMLFERTAVSRKREQLIHSTLAGLRDQGSLSPDLVFRDPYVLDFLGLKDAHEQGPGEDSPLGLILCGANAHEAVELLRLDEAGIRVAEYLTELPPRELLENRLQAATLRARAALEHGVGQGL